MSSRKLVLAGNWKMNKTPAQALALIRELLELVPQTRHTVAVFPTHLALEAVAKQAAARFVVGAQNCHFEASGAYTGELSAEMLREAGAAAVLVGHSERRQYFAENDGTVNKKAAAALRAGLTPYICIGETLPQREAGGYLTLLEGQLRAALGGLQPEQVARTVVAYEPVWAIGTGVTASDEQAEEVCAMLHALLRTMYGASADTVPVLYGGSVNAANAGGLFRRPGIDGALIGGASLKPVEFAQIVAQANSVE